jgi:hypothetical protein
LHLRSDIFVCLCRHPDKSDEPAHPGAAASPVRGISRAGQLSLAGGTTSDSDNGVSSNLMSDKFVCQPNPDPVASQPSVLID